MKSINNILQVANKELYYQWCSKKIAILLFILLFLSIFHLIGLHNRVITSYNRYQRTEMTYRENGIDIVKALEQPNNVYVENNSKITSNPLKDDFISLAIAIQSLKPRNIISNTLEYLVFVFCTLIFGIYAAYVATYDFRFKTYKFVSVGDNQRDIILGKLLSVIITMTGTMVFVLIFTFIGSFIVNPIVVAKVPVKDFTIDIFNYEYGIIPQLFLSFIVILFYVIVGFSIGFILKSMLIPTIGLLLYGLFIPVLGAYDFRNIISYFSHQVFTFTARFVMFKPMPINEVLGILLTLATAVILFVVLFTVAKKRSAYS
ncbi:hypothetical protein [Defluviitalea saccharophila]|uniref:ABC transporter permease n=1 Tax=Defluviitalea saccharophila TaxID=879970 RepID=A0ABZ2Y4A5_9FIRM|nr:hypothetical protein [Candidatus Epulonipiscium sp.]